MNTPVKYKRNTLPDNHIKDDFECFGPCALKDAEFDNTMMADMGCFKQEQIDSNKYLHVAVIKSTLNNNWFLYTEWGRVGNKPDFQFIQFSSKKDAIEQYIKKCHAKNDKRGIWTNHPSLGRILQAKPGKDCYLVRPQATRTTGLPSAKTIVTGVKVKSKGKSTSSPDMDPESVSLLNDLNVSTIEYTKTSVVNSCIPTQEAIEECRNICAEATKINNANGHGSKRELLDLTRMIYSRIPKRKARKVEESEWILTPENIKQWQDDLDAFEGALQGQKAEVVCGDLPFSLEYLSENSDLGRFAREWFTKATRNAHSYIRRHKVHGIWKINRSDSEQKFTRNIKAIKNVANPQKPLFQFERKDLDTGIAKQYNDCNVCLLFHGTRTVNVSSILTNFFRLPRELSRNLITAAMYGSGHYSASDWKKSAGYTSNDNAIYARGQGKVRRRHLFMFMNDIVVGDAFIPPGPRGYTAPPNNKHSVFAKAGNGGLMNEEIVVFNTSYINMRYLVEFSF